MPVTLDLANLVGLAPLYHHYPRQTEAQGAFVELDESGTVSADWNAEIGNGVPSFVFHRRTLRWSVPSAVNGDALREYLEGDGLPLLARIHTGHTVEWDGSNHVGHLSEDAQLASLELDNALQAVDTDNVQRVADWLENIPWVDLWPAGESLATTSEEWSKQARADLVKLVGDVDDYILERASQRDVVHLEAMKSLCAVGRAESLCDLLTESVNVALAQANQGRMDSLDGFAVTDRVEALAQGTVAVFREAVASLNAGLLATGKDWSWLPLAVRDRLACERVEALQDWALSHTLRDSDTLEPVEIPEDDRLQVVVESLACAQTEGHVLFNGRRVFAQ